MVYNTSNPNHPFNPMAPYLDTSPVQVGNLCALLFSFQFPHFELQNSFRLSHFNRLSLSHSRRSTLSPSTLSASPSTPSSPLPAYPTQTHKKKQRKNGIRDCDPQTRASTTLSTSTLSASPSTPSSSLPVYPTQTHKKKQ